MTTLTTDAAEIVEARIKRAAGLVEYIEANLAATGPEIPPAGILAGPLRRAEMPNLKGGPGWGEDNLHYPMDVGTLLRLGCVGIAATARANAETLAGDRAHYLLCIARTYEAVTAFVAAHVRVASERAAAAGGAERQRLQTIADNCAALAAGGPQTFAQAVQLFWFVHCLRGMHGISSTIGRLDQHLQPFYKKQLDAGTLSREEAMEILCDLWRGLNAVVAHPAMGLMNLMVGGQDADGSVTNNSSSRAATLTTGGDNTSTTYSGVMANGSSKALGLTKTGTGRLSLSGVNTYTGATSITGGTLALTGSGSINSTSGITLNGGTLMQDSSTPLNRTITFTSGTIGGTGAYTGNMSPGSVHIAPGDGGAGTFAISGNLTMASASVLDFDLSTVGGSNDLLTMTGALTLDGTLNVSAPGGGLGSGQYTLISGFGSLTDNTLNLGSMPPGHNYTITTDATHVYLNASPEPATLCLLALGGLALLKKRIARSRKG